MSVIGKLIISLVVAAIATALLGLIHGTATSSMILFAAFSAATVVTALLTSIKINVPGAAQMEEKASTRAPAKKPASKPAKKTAPRADSANREEGEVKWFNVTKGFGFITRNNGDEIFVHFRSIRGDGRRSLRDGQRVSYVVTDSDKGPQAEDVEGL